MANTPVKSSHNIRYISSLFFDGAKFWFNLSFLLKFLIFVVSFISIAFSVIIRETPFIVAFLSIVAEICSWRSDMLRGIAEDLHRKLDLQDSLGWPIPQYEINDILLQLPEKQQRISMSIKTESFFASKEQIGPVKALKNLQESSWFTKHLSLRMFLFYFVATCILTIVSLSMLIISIETAQNINNLQNISRIVTSTFVLIFSLGIARSAYSYYRLSLKAQSTEKSARDILRTSSIDQIEVMHLWHDYQIARRTAPMIPTILWRFMRNRLNHLWSNYITDTTS